MNSCSVKVEVLSENSTLINFEAVINIIGEEKNVKRFYDNLRANIYGYNIV